MFYVYIISDLGSPFYVGMGKGDRYLSHEQYARGEASLGYGLKADYNPRKTRKLKKMIREGRFPEYSFWYCNSEDGAHLLEKQLISHYGRRGIDRNGILMNFHPGGIGGDTFNARSETDKDRLRQLHAAAQKRVYAERGDEIREKIKATKLRNGSWAVMSDETCRKISASNRQRCIGQRIAIQQFTIEGELVAAWPSLKEATMILQIHQGPISNALDKLRADGSPRTAAGYVWKRNHSD